MFSGVIKKLKNVENIKRPLLFTFVLIILITFLVTMLSTLHFANSVLKENIHEQFEEVSNFYKDEIRAQEKVQELVNFSLSRNKRILALLSGESETYEETHSIYNYLNQQQNITHFYLISAKKQVLYRAHQPQRKGDIINRHTMAQAQKQLTTVSGLEFGILGTFTLRTVTPVLNHGRVIGFIEVGMEIGHVIERAEKQFQVSMFELFDKQLVPEDTSDKLLQITGRKSNQNSMANYVINYNQSIQLNDSLITNLQKAISGVENLEQGVAAEVSIINDFNGKVVGKHVLFMNIEHLLTQRNNQLINITLIYFITLIIGFMVFVSALTYVEKTITRYIEQQQRDNELIQEKVVELQSAQQQLVEKEKLASLGNVVAGVAHEVNTPIGVAVTVASTIESHIHQFIERIKAGSLKRSTLTDFESNTNECLKVLMPALDKASTLIHSFKQVAVDQTSEARRQFLLGDVIEEVIITLQHQIKNRDININVDISKSIEMDSFPGPLGQVITNLFNNAICHAFMPEDVGNITISAKQQQDNVFITVVDNGAGIAPENLSKIFDPFYTTKFGQGGSGLGLNIVYNTVISILAGQIDVESTLTQGTKFTVTLPISLPKEEQ